MRTIFFGFLLFLMPIMVCYAQQMKVSYDSVLNERVQIVDAHGTAGSIRIKDIKTKYVVLDFWATWCSPCIENQKVLEEIYAKNADSLTIVTISGDKYERFMAFSRKWKTNLIRGIDAKGIIFKKYNISTVPTMILLNKQDAIVKVVEGEVFKEDSFKKFKDPNYKGINFTKRRLTMDQVDDSLFRNVIHQSYIKEAPYDPNIPSVIIIKKLVDQPIERLIFVNSSIAGVYIFCNKMTELRTVYKNMGPKAYFCFDIANVKDDLMKEDTEKELMKYLKKSHPEIKATIKNTLVDSCYYLVRNGKQSIAVSKLPKNMEFNGGSLVTTNSSMHDFANFLEEQVHLAIEDRTGLKKGYDFKLDLKPEDPGALISQLAEHGLKLILKKNVRINMLFIENN